MESEDCQDNLEAQYNQKVTENKIFTENDQEDHEVTMGEKNKL